jgi:hypothetical protein
MKNNIIWTAMCMILVISILGLLGILLVAAFLIPQGVWQLIVIIAGVILFLIPCFYALSLEIKVGYNKCPKCNRKIIPKYSQALASPHVGFTRYLKCPDCEEKNWCKKIID